MLGYTRPNYTGRGLLDEISDRLLRVISELDEIADAATPAEAAGAMDDSVLQLFWRRWPHVSSWTGTLWRLLNEDISEPALAPTDDYDEVGGGD